MPIFFIIVGLVYVLFPRFAWSIEVKWKSHKKEPSKNNILINRIIGIILCLIGIFYLVK